MNAHKGAPNPDGATPFSALSCFARCTLLSRKDSDLSWPENSHVDKQNQAWREELDPLCFWVCPGRFGLVSNVISFLS